MEFRLYKLLIPVFVVALCSCIKENDSYVSYVGIGDRLPDFEVEMMDGTSFATEDTEGKVSCVLLFSLECGDCRRVLPEVDSLYRTYRDNGDVVVVGIGRESGYDVVSSFWDANGLVLPVSPQDDRKVYSLFANGIVPRIYITDRNGRVRFMFDDNPVPSFEEMNFCIESLID